MKKTSALLKLIATGSLSIILTACYGMVAPMYGIPYAIKNYGKGRIKTIDGNGKVIPALKVTMLELNKIVSDSVTDDEGEYAYELSSMTEYDNKLRIEDVDGENNGGKFKTRELYVFGSEETEAIYMASESDLDEGSED